MNKEAELFYLNRFKENFLNFPQGDVCPSERPDFLVRDLNKTVGIEVTKFYREMSVDGTVPLQQRESARRKILEQAKSVYDLKELPSVHVHVHFDLNFHCGQREICGYAERLVELARRSVLEHAGHREWNREGVALNGVHSLNVRKSPIPKSYWSAPLASFVPTVGQRQIQDILDKKNVLCHEYQKKCDVAWLLIAMDRFDASSFSLIPENIRDLLFSYHFDAAYLFLYDYSDDQKPPIHLRSRKAARFAVIETCHSNGCGKV